MGCNRSIANQAWLRGLEKHNNLFMPQARLFTLLSIEAKFVFMQMYQVYMSISDMYDK